MLQKSKNNSSIIYKLSLYFSLIPTAVLRSSIVANLFCYYFFLVKRNNNQSVHRHTIGQHLRIKYIFTLAIVLLCSIHPKNVAAQAKTPQQIMTGIYKAYDSLSNLTFDVKAGNTSFYSYSSLEYSK